MIPTGAEKWEWKMSYCINMGLNPNKGWEEAEYEFQKQFEKPL